MSDNMDKIKNICRLFSFILYNLITLSQGEFFTAISDVEPLLETHKQIIDDLDDYIKKEENRSEALKRHLTIYKREHEKAMEDIPNYLGNPINAFTLIKRLTIDLDDIKRSIDIGTEYIKNITIMNNQAKVKYPTLEDLTGAAQALTRLQQTYQLEVKDLSEGRLNGVIYSPTPVSKDEAITVSTPMSAGDCYELGKTLYNGKDYKNVLAWMLEALYKFVYEDKPYPFRKADIMEYISFSHYFLGDLKNAMQWTKKLLLVDPKHDRALFNLPHYIKALEEQGLKMYRKRKGDSGEANYGNEKQEPRPNKKVEYRKNYEALCRGEKDIAPEISKTLTCRYLTENHPFLKLAPIKMEYVYRNPDIVVFIEVLSQYEIDYIKSLAQPRFRRATVLNSNTGELVPAHYRISKSAWLGDEESAVIARVSRRVQHFTGLDMRTAEELQVVNYGIGGHYGPHYDFIRKEEKVFARFKGNRIATVLFYMSDVAQGGATVFTELGLSVFPRRGSAVFWLNLHPSGEGDLATRHAACPVLRGSKWVCNKWIHQGGQEFIKPCNLEYQKESIIRPILQAVKKYI